MIYSFNETEINTFKSILTASEYELLFANLGSKGKGSVSEISFNEKEIDRLIDLISNKFMEIGLQPDSEPNPLGLKIESLIDKLNRDE